MCIDIMSVFFLEISGNIQYFAIHPTIFKGKSMPMCCGDYSWLSRATAVLCCQLDYLWKSYNPPMRDTPVRVFGLVLEGESTPTLDQWIRKILTFNPDFVSERHLRFRIYLLLEAYIMLWTKEVFVLCLFAILFLASLLLHCY